MGHKQVQKALYFAWGLGITSIQVAWLGETTSAYAISHP